MGHRNGIFALLAIALSSAALASMVYTDAYSQAAGAEAQGYDALSREVRSSQVWGEADAPANLALSEVRVEAAPQ
jgi:hypothetical protein